SFKGVAGIATASGSLSVSVTVNGKESTVKADVQVGDDAKAVTASIATAINDLNAGVGAFVNDDGDEIMLMSNLDEKGTGNALTAAGVTGTVAGITETGTATVEENIDNAKKLKIADIDLGTIEGSQKAIVAIDQAIQKIDAQRADLGAVQNRFENTIGILQNIYENVSAARGGITDTDFAAETANLSKQQVMQQAGTAILAQANQLPQSVLSLLR